MGGSLTDPSGADHDAAALRALCLVLLTACAGAPPKEKTAVAELIIVGKVRAAGEVAEAVAVRDGKVTWLGARADAAARRGPETRWLEVPVVLPGLVDSHAHLTGLGMALSRLDLRETDSAAAVAKMVAEAGGTGWILGRGWDQNDWADTAFPTHEPLTAAAPGRPVALRRIDGHVVWANAAAMAAAGVTKDTPDPPGGRIERDAAGQPTGIFLDAAMGLVEGSIPPPDAAQVRAWMLRAVEACHAVGLTGVHDAGASALQVQVYQQLEAEGALPLRVHVFLAGGDPGVDALIDKGPQPGEFASIRGVKLFADGALGSRGAWLHAPYSDKPDTTGIPIVHGPALQAAVKRAAAAGFQVGTHAIGDAAATDVMDAYEAALPQENDRRFRIEHAQVVRASDRARMAAYGVIAMVQPTHATSDMPWAEARLGPERIRDAYAWRSLKQDGVRLSLGSDFPVERPHPLEGLYAAVTRKDKQGEPAAGWYPEESLTAQEALDGFTIDAAYAEFAEHRRGRIAVGMDADFTLLDLDPLDTDPSEWLSAKVLGVVVAGRVHGKLP